MWNLKEEGVVLRISPISIMYFVGIAFTFAGMGLLTAGIVIPGMIGVILGVIVLYRTVNTRVRLKEKEEERKAKEEIEEEKEKKLKKARTAQKGRVLDEGITYPCESLVKKGLRDIDPYLAQAIENLDKSSYEELADELELLLIGVQWRWPEFGRFMEEIEGRRTLPVLWRDLGILSWDIPPAANSILIEYVLKGFNKLSKNAKLILLRNDLVGVTEKKLIPFEEFKNNAAVDGFEIGLKELLDLGAVEYLSDNASRLKLLQSVRLVEIMEEHEIRVKERGKEAAISKIIEEVPEEELKKIFASEELPDNMIRGGIIVSKDLYAAIKWEHARIRLLAHTIYSTKKNRDIFKSISSSEDEMKSVQVIGQGNNCAVCKEKLRKDFRKPVEIKKLKVEDIPPFHPGCRCSLEEVK